MGHIGHRAGHNDSYARYLGGKGMEDNGQGSVTLLVGIIRIESIGHFPQEFCNYLENLKYLLHCWIIHSL